MSATGSDLNRAGAVKVKAERPDSYGYTRRSTWGVTPEGYVLARGDYDGQYRNRGRVPEGTTDHLAFITNLLTERGYTVTPVTRKGPESGPHMTEYQMRSLYNRAREAGKAALEAATPTPMVVQQHASPFDDNSAVVQRWVVPGGVCGFAWVNVTPGTSAFARWLVKNGYAHKSYSGGVDIWVRDGGQSMERKEAYARAMATVLREAGIKAYMSSRMD